MTKQKRAVHRKVAKPKASEPDPQIVLAQTELARLGYFDVGPPDGVLGPKTQAAILDFQNRSKLSLSGKIDAALIEALKTAPPKEIPVEQATATVKDIAPKVDAVNAAAKTVSMTWWQKFTTWVLTVPTTVLFVAEQSGAVLPFIGPAKQTFTQTPETIWLYIFGGLLVAYAIQAHLASKAAQKTQDASVEGYRVGTVKNDAPKTNGNGATVKT